VNGKQVKPTAATVTRRGVLAAAPAAAVSAAAAMTVSAVGSLALPGAAAALVMAPAGTKVRTAEPGSSCNAPPPPGAPTRCSRPPHCW
jgi:hypothetical protein